MSVAVAFVLHIAAIVLAGASGCAASDADKVSARWLVVLAFLLSLTGWALLAWGVA